MLIAESESEVKPQQNPGRDISPEDRHLLLAATFRLFLRRVRHGIPVTASDVIRLAAYADPGCDEGAAA